ncbi:MAG: delta-60 repeat domain-containing protein, partial [Actinomycetota bacterium]
MRGRRPLPVVFALLALLAAGPAASAQTAGALDPSLVDPLIGGDVNTIAPMADGQIVVAGSFTALGLTTQWRVARIAINGTPSEDFANPNVDNTVNAAALQPDGKVVIVGTFVSVGGTGVNGVARLTTFGTRDAGFANPGVLGGANLLRAVAVQPDGKILIAGDFTSVGASTRSRIARLNANGTLDSGFGDAGVANFGIRAIALQADGKIIIGGDFTSIGSTAMSGVARLNADGTLDTSFANPGITLTGTLPVVNALALRADGKIVIGGQFSHIGGTPYAGAARLNANGTLDATFANPQIAGGGTAVNALVVQADGKVIIGGNFATVGGQTYGRVARLNADGTPDTGFENPTANSFAKSIALQPDGKALIGGNFTTIRGTAASYLARVFATSPQAAPTGVTATAGDGQATVSWTAIPGAITGYT